jgi:hypothetical protein
MIGMMIFRTMVESCNATNACNVNANGNANCNSTTNANIRGAFGFVYASVNKGTFIPAFEIFLKTKTMCRKWIEFSERHLEKVCASYKLSWFGLYLIKNVSVKTKVWLDR